MPSSGHLSADTKFHKFIYTQSVIVIRILLVYLINVWIKISRYSGYIQVSLVEVAVSFTMNNSIANVSDPLILLCINWPP